MQRFERITLNPKVMGGRPCIRGTRVTVGMIIGLLNEEWSSVAIREAYPNLEDEDIREAKRYAAWWETLGKQRPPL